MVEEESRLTEEELARTKARTPKPTRTDSLSASCSQRTGCSEPAVTHPQDGGRARGWSLGGRCKHLAQAGLDEVRALLQL